MALSLTRRSLGGLLLPVALGAGLARPARAELAEPAGKKILTISGKIRVHNHGETAEFDRPMLETIGMSSFQTNTPWYDGMVRFEGVPMTRLLETVGAFGDRVTAIALNDYTTEIPVSDFAKYGVLLALKRDGNYMPVSDKGPLFIVYPYDSAPELKKPPYSGRSAWQVAQLIIK